MIECLMNYLDGNLEYIKQVAPLSREMAINFMERQVGVLIFCFQLANKTQDKPLAATISAISEEYNAKVKEVIFQ